MAARTLADPEANRSMSTVAQFLDSQARRARVIHKYGHVWALDDNAGVKPFVTVGFRGHRLFELIGTLRPELLPGPKRMGDVLHRVTVASRVSRSKVEWPEVHRVVRLRIHDVEGDTEKAPLNGLAASQHVNFNCAVGKVITVEPHDAHACVFADLEGVLPLSINNRCGAAGDLPSRIFSDSSEVEGFR